MTEEINYKNNPLNGVGLKTMITQLVEHYGFEILHAYLNLNSFKNNPSIGSSITFLKKTDWAREKVEDFYLYQFKSLPKPNYEQLQVPPRDRIIPDEQKPGEPAQLSVEDGERLQGERKERSERHDRKKNYRTHSTKLYNTEKRKQNSSKTQQDQAGKINPWGNRK